METILIYKGLAYVAISSITMCMAFIYQWANDPNSEDGWQGAKKYLFGDKKAIVKAISILIASYGGLTALNFLGSLDYSQLAVMAATNGLAVPKKFNTQVKV